MIELEFINANFDGGRKTLDASKEENEQQTQLTFYSESS
jgi:hypothetical protein